MIIDRNYSLNDNMNDISIKLLDFGHARTTGDRWIGNIVSPMYTRLYYIVGGTPYIIVNGEKRYLEIGKCYMFPTGFSFKHACDSSMEQLYFHLNLHDFSGTDLLRSANTVMEYTPPEGVIDKLLKYTQSTEPADSLWVKNQIYTSILTLIGKYGLKLKTTHYSRCVVLAMDYIKAHLNLRISISELAANCFVSESTLAKKFKAELGMTIGSYIDDSILFEAEQLLMKSDLTVLQISERFGFCDQFYFSRRFKKKYGETPQKYRKLHLI